MTALSGEKPICVIMYAFSGLRSIAAHAAIA
jgi:hypothetical protein